MMGLSSFNMAALSAKVARLEKRIPVKVPYKAVDDGPPLQYLDWRALSGMISLPTDATLMDDNVVRGTLILTAQSGSRMVDPRNELDLKLEQWIQAVSYLQEI
jgi:hypothetical protein